jgi:ubiquinone/menaquinone biosynthesis C-methylase UbiE
MTILIPERKYDADLPEMIDNPGADATLLRDELKSIRTINRFFGGHASIRRGMKKLLNAVGREEVSVLDLGTGSADLPVYLVHWFRRINQRVRITAVDNHPRVVEVARERTRTYAEISIETANLLNLNYPPGAFDIVMCSLTLHHFSDEDAAAIIRSMNKICRTGFLVIDLERNWIAAWITKCYTHLTTRNPMTLTDSYRSVLRGFTPDELRAAVHTAGLRDVEIQRRPFFRLLLTGKRQTDAGF